MKRIHSPEAERAFLGCILMRPEAFAQYAALPDGFFYEREHADIYKAMQAAHAAGLKLDAVTLYTYLPDKYNLSDIVINVPLSSNLPYYADVLRQFYRKRQIIDRARLLSSIAADDDPVAVTNVWQQLLNAYDMPDSEPETRTALDLLDNPPEPDKILIDGLLIRGGVWCVTGASKAGKSCMLLQAALCMAAGSKLLGYACEQSTVLVVDLETPPGLLHSKIKAMIDHGEFQGWLPRKDRDYLRRVSFAPPNAGAVTIDSIIDMARRERACNGPRDVLIVDPLYLIDAHTGRDENAAGETTRLLTGMKAAADILGASLLYSHHHSKGNQSQRDFMDRAAGSGVHARFAFALSSITATDDGGHLMESITRGFRMPDPMPLQFQWPCFSHLPSGSTRLKGQSGRPTTVDDSAITDYIEKNGVKIKQQHISASIKDISSALSVSEKTIRRRAESCGLLIENGFIHVQTEDTNYHYVGEEIPF